MESRTTNKLGLHDFLNIFFSFVNFSLNTAVFRDSFSSYNRFFYYYMIICDIGLLIH